MSFLNSKNITSLATTLFAVFIVVSLISSVYFMGMNPDGIMSHCVFMGGICNMTLSDHLISWQNMFAMSLQKAVSLDFLLLIVSLALALTIIIFRLAVGQTHSHDFISRLYYKQKRYLSFFDYLKEAFSQGILNPKIYNLAVI